MRSDEAWPPHDRMYNTPAPDQLPLGRYPLGRHEDDHLGVARPGVARARAERIIVVSNRGPVEHRFDAAGEPYARRGAGGVVSGLLSALGERPATWISLAMTEADRAVAAGADAAGDAAMHAADGPGRDGAQLALRLVDIRAERYRRYYEGISNRVLWFAQHYLLNPVQARLSSKRTARDWHGGYLPVNDAVADAVIAELRAHPGASVLFQDYHLYLAPARVRAARPEARLAQFIHIPWPEARYWELLPEYMTAAIFAGLAANDVVGFQTDHDAANFLYGALRFLDGAELDPTGALLWQGRRILIRVYPIAVSPDEVYASSRTEAAAASYGDLRARLGLDDLHRVILRVDRIEPTKNIVLGFQAYERLLCEHSEYRRRVTFLALLVPSRQSMPEYRAYERRVQAVIERVNRRFGDETWQPIVTLCGNDRARALACMRRYDVLLVNPLIDGMNLVVKEGGLVNAHRGVVVLSRTAGAHEQLADFVLGIPPADLDATVAALDCALHMPLGERTTRSRRLRAFLQAEDAVKWLDAQLRDLRTVARPILGASRAGTDIRLAPVAPRIVSPVSPATAPQVAARDAVGGSSLISTGTDSPDLLTLPS